MTFVLCGLNSLSYSHQASLCFTFANEGVGRNILER
jgi:hypothetical protein